MAVSSPARIMEKRRHELVGTQKQHGGKQLQCHKILEIMSNLLCCAPGIPGQAMLSLKSGLIASIDLLT